MMQKEIIQLKFIEKKSGSDRKFPLTSAMPATFITFVLIIGALIPTTETIFSGQLLNQVLADTVTGTDDNDKLKGSDGDDDIEGKGGNDKIDSKGGDDSNT